MSDSSSSTTPTPTPTPSNNNTFTKWSRNFSYITGIGMTMEERRKMTRDLHLRNCGRMMNYQLDWSPTIHFMLQHLEVSGCAVPRENILCMTCGDPGTGGNARRAGGFIGSGAISLCAGVFESKKHVESTIVHELIHMYDQCRFKVDWGNLRHHACSEIRANSLSGDCRLLAEINRGQIGFTKNHQACVRRRAVQSLMANPACGNDRTVAEKAVNEVFESCFADTRPFDEIF